LKIKKKMLPRLNNRDVLGSILISENLELFIEDSLRTLLKSQTALDLKSTLIILSSKGTFLMGKYTVGEEV